MRALTSTPRIYSGRGYWALPAPVAQRIERAPPERPPFPALDTAQHSRPLGRQTRPPAVQLSRRIVIYTGPLPAPVAQGIERAPPEREVAGSIPAGRIARLFGPAWARSGRGGPETPGMQEVSAGRGREPPQPRGIAKGPFRGACATEMSHGRRVAHGCRRAAVGRAACPRGGATPLPPGPRAFGRRGGRLFRLPCSLWAQETRL
jgi:hypothetical protein